MAGIYIHIPFCKQACTYCDFHFSTSLTHQNDLVDAICKELKLRKDYIHELEIDTIYFGGGTPSLLTEAQLNKIFSTIRTHFRIITHPEITLEANPEDIIAHSCGFWKDLGINRLSIGIQSFDDVVLTWMNRSHSSVQAINGIEAAQSAGINNISCDVIYAVPLGNIEQPMLDAMRLTQMGIPHISAYSLTVEPKTALYKKVISGNTIPMDEDRVVYQYSAIENILEDHGFIHYEISNYGLPNNFSKHNTNYWKRVQYLGIGPSAHSYNTDSRSHNISNNASYIRMIQSNNFSFNTLEHLSTKDHINEHLLTGLRTIWGCDINYLNTLGFDILSIHKKVLDVLVDEYLLEIRNDHILLTKKGKLFADSVALDLFMD